MIPSYAKFALKILLVWYSYLVAMYAHANHVRTRSPIAHYVEDLLRNHSDFTFRKQMYSLYYFVC